MFSCRCLGWLVTGSVQWSTVRCCPLEVKLGFHSGSLLKRLISVSVTCLFCGLPPSLPVSPHLFLSSSVPLSLSPSLPSPPPSFLTWICLSNRKQQISFVASVLLLIIVCSHLCLRCVGSARWTPCIFLGRDGSALQLGTGHSCRGPELGAQCLHGSHHPVAGI